MNLETTYLGLNLIHPIMPGASPMADTIDGARRLEDGGSAAIVMRSLFQEQTSVDRAPGFPSEDEYQVTPDDYFEHVRKLKETVAVPVIASINGSEMGAWIDFARSIEQAGADALELNFYYVATDPSESSHDVEAGTLEVLRAVRESVDLPIAVKLSPYYSSLCYFARELEALGADGLVLFNRFYQPDFNPETREHSSHLELSNPVELRLRLRWLGILHGTLNCSLACTGGVHRGTDVVKAIMAGASAVQCVSCLLHFGPQHIRTLVDGLKLWMEANEYQSVLQMTGRMSLKNCPDAAAYERANYLRVLNMWKV